MATHVKLKFGGLIRKDTSQSQNLWRNNLALFIALMMTIFILPALPGEDRLITSIMLTLIVISGLYAAEFSPRIFKALLAFGFLVIVVSVVDKLFLLNKALNAISFFAYTIFFTLVTVALVAHVASAKKADRSTILCAINSYLLLGLTASIFIIILDLIQPQSFTQIDLATSSASSYIYFGFVTLSTLGYGDITPSTPLARSLAIFTALSGQLYLVIVMALIIGKYLNSRSVGQDSE